MKVGETIYAVAFTFQDKIKNETLNFPMYGDAHEIDYFALTVTSVDSIETRINPKIYLVDQYNNKWMKEPSFGENNFYSFVRLNLDGSISASNILSRAVSLNSYLSWLREFANQFKEDTLHVKNYNQILDSVISAAKRVLFIEIEEERYGTFLFKDSMLGAASLLLAYSVIGDSANWPYILLGKFDFQISIIAYHNKYKCLPETSALLRTKEIREGVELFKNNLRAHLQGMIDSLGKEKEREYKLEKVKKQFHKPKDVSKTTQAKDFLNMNKPNEQGTVAEIAQRLGISKAEVRRRKAANLL